MTGLTAASPNVEDCFDVLWERPMEKTGAALPVTARNRTETISHRGKLLCMIVRAESFPDTTTFYTPADLSLQVGNIVYSAGSEIPRHMHGPVSRGIIGTAEVLMVQKGCMFVDIYADDRTFVGSREIGRGDVAVLVAGGHGFRFAEDTVLLEVKQGPYAGAHEKEHF